jgi:hypothetical protein
MTDYLWDQFGVNAPIVVKNPARDLEMLLYNYARHESDRKIIELLFLAKHESRGFPIAEVLEYLKSINLTSVGIAKIQYYISIFNQIQI